MSTPRRRGLSQVAWIASRLATASAKFILSERRVAGHCEPTYDLRGTNPAQWIMYKRSQALINLLDEHTTIRDEEVRWAYEIPDKVFDFAVADSNFPFVRACSRN